MKTSPPGRSAPAKIGAKSASSRTGETRNGTPSVPAASCRARSCEGAVGLVGLNATAKDWAPGTASSRYSRRLPETSTLRLDTPVRLPRGRAKSCTTPSATGSPPISNTIGIVAVAALAASATGAPPGAASTATRRATSSRARSGSRS